jgi:uncharacterized repeat protein (TIGR02543 family)
MKTKKIVIAVLAATLLISAALIVGCIDPESGAFGKLDLKENDYQIPPGKGLVVLNISQKIARTILPSSGVPSSAAGLFFDVVFSPDSSVGGNTAVSATFPASGDKYDFTHFDQVPFPLVPGTYDITITAYKAADGSGVIAGWSNVALGKPSTPVTSSVVNVPAINLVVFSGLGNGTFEYNITYAVINSAGLLTPVAYTASKQTLDIYNYGGTLVQSVPLSTPGALTSNNGTPLSLPAGYYTVIVKLEASNCQDRVLDNVMHIYPGLLSIYTNNSVPAPNQNQFTVNFSLNGIAPDGADNTYLEDLSGSGGPDTTDYSGRNHQYPLSNADLVASPGLPDNDGYDFIGWFESASPGPSDVAWDILTRKVFRDRTLYAKWEPKAGAKFTITLDVIDPDISVTGDTPPFSYADILADTKNIVFTVDNDTDFDSISWKFNGATVGSGATLTIGGGFTSLLNLVDGTHYITAVCMKGSTPTNKQVSFVVTNF